MAKEIKIRVDKTSLSKDGSKVLSYLLVWTKGRVDRKKIEESKRIYVPADLQELKAKNEKPREKWKQQEIAAFRKELEAGQFPSERKTFAVYSRYVIDLKKQDRKPRTIDGYTTMLKRLDPALGTLLLTDIKPEHINLFYSSLIKDGCTPRTVSHYHAFIHLVFEQAYKEGLLNVNTADRATPPTVPKKEADFFEVEEVQEIMALLDKEPLKWRTITYLLIYSGARRGEIMGLKWSAVDFENNTINICNNLQYFPGKGNLEGTPKTGRNRVISIAPEVMAMLKKWQTEQTLIKMKHSDIWQDTGFCFTQDNGEPMNADSPTHWLGKFAKKNNLPSCHPHKFRHTHVTMLLHNGVAVNEVSRRVGHEQVSTTLDIYSHVFKGSDQTLSECISSALRKQA